MNSVQYPSKSCFGMGYEEWIDWLVVLSRRRQNYFCTSAKRICEILERIEGDDEGERKRESKGGGSEAEPLLCKRLLSLKSGTSKLVTNVAVTPRAKAPRWRFPPPLRHEIGQEADVFARRSTKDNPCHCCRAPVTPMSQVSSQDLRLQRAGCSCWLGRSSVVSSKGSRGWRYGLAPFESSACIPSLLASRISLLPRCKGITESVGLAISSGTGPPSCRSCIAEFPSRMTPLPRK